MLLKRWSWCFGLAVLAASAWAQTTVKVYRYELQTRQGDNLYRDEVTGGVPAKGQFHEVETDPQGRMVRESDYVNGKEIGSWRFHYPGASVFSDSGEQWQDGKVLNVVKIKRDESGQMTAWKQYTVSGELTNYSEYENKGDHFEFRNYKADGSQLGRDIDYFDDEGILVRRLRFPRDVVNTYTESAYDERTGLVLSLRQFNSGHQVNSSVITRSEDGVVLRRDVYGPHEEWYSADEYSDGLKQKRIYALPDGRTKEIRYEYDKNGWYEKSELYVGGILICTFTYEDANPDGTLNHTIARGPDGTVWATYAPPVVIDVGADGQPPMRTDGKIFHQGKWW